MFEVAVVEDIVLDDKSYYFGNAGGWNGIGTVAFKKLKGGMTAMDLMAGLGSFVGMEGPIGLKSAVNSTVGGRDVRVMKQFGGDDGLSVAMASDFHLFQLSTATSVYYCAWALLVALTIWIDRLKKAPFGMVLQAGRQNSRRVNSVGLPLKRYQLMAYIISAMICGIAGMLLVNLTAYATPSTMSWLVSGDLIVMVVLGGMGTVIGPIVGAFVFLGLEEILKAFIDSWMIFLGLFIFAIAIVGKVGIVGFLLRVKKS
jgi:branched-chain amino acid transport system permease protein